MAISLGQRLKLWWRGSKRRREERDAEFVAKNAAWTSVTGGDSAAGAESAREPRAATQHAAAQNEVDLAGLQAAYLDRSGVIHYYLDVESGEVVESRAELTDERYVHVPTQSEEDDQRAFLRTLTLPQRARFQKAESFRAAVAEDRTIERAWYNFKNDRATAAVDAWLKTIRRSG